MRHSARKVFNKLAALNADIDSGIQGAVKVKRRMADSWVKRSSGVPGDLYKASNAKTSICYTM